MKIGRIAKAIVAGLAAGATALVTAAQDDVITSGEGVTAVLAVLASLGITWAVPNKSATGPGTGTGTDVTTGF